MTALLASIGIIIIGTVLYFTYRQFNLRLKKIDAFVKAQALDKGLKIRAITYPSINEWKDEPFDKEIKIGTLGLYGIPTNEQYYRVLDCLDTNSNISRTFWVRVTNNRRTKTRPLNGKRKTNAR